MNRILDSLSAAEAASVLPQLELVPLNLNAVLSEADVAISHVYFSVTGLISLVTTVDGIGVESAAIGSEGMRVSPPSCSPQNRVATASSR